MDTNGRLSLDEKQYSFIEGRMSTGAWTFVPPKPITVGGAWQCSRPGWASRAGSAAPDGSLEIDTLNIVGLAVTSATEGEMLGVLKLNVATATGCDPEQA